MKLKKRKGNTTGKTYTLNVSCRKKIFRKENVANKAGHNMRLQTTFGLLWTTDTLFCLRITLSECHIVIHRWKAYDIFYNHLIWFLLAVLSILVIHASLRLLNLEERRDGRMNGQTAIHTDGWVYGWMDGQMDRRMDGWTDG